MTQSAVDGMATVQVEATPKVDAMCARIADDIVNGRLSPGYRLEEMRLAERFGVSRTPVREALRQLEVMGLVKKRPNRGVEVISIDNERLTHMFEAMAEMEMMAARLCASRMTEREREELARQHADSQRFVETGDIAGYESANTQFHSLLYRGTHNPTIEQMCLDIRRRVSPFRRNQFRMTGRLTLSFDEHDSVVAAILAGDGTTAVSAMRRHITVVKAASSAWLDVGERAE